MPVFFFNDFVKLPSGLIIVNKGAEYFVEKDRILFKFNRQFKKTVNILYLGEISIFDRKSLVPLNESNQDLLVNFIEYWEVTPNKVKHFSWVTDFTVTKKNAYQLMRGGRARWKIENETFNTLKNQGYHFEHNYGLGKKNLSLVFAMLIMLAFLVDQTQQLSCNLFRSVWRKQGSKRALWERMRSLFKEFAFESMEMLYKAILYGVKYQPPIILYDTS